MLDAPPAKLEGTLKVAVSDVTGSGRAGRLRLLVPDTRVGVALGRYYGAALEKLGGSLLVASTASAAQAVSWVRAGRADVAVLTLGTLAAAIEADVPPGTDLSAQVQAVATAALAQQLALGSTADASTQAEVRVSRDLADARSLGTLTDLSEACADALIGAGPGGGAAAKALADAYGFALTDDGTEPPDPAAAFTLGDLAYVIDPLR